MRVTFPLLLCLSLALWCLAEEEDELFLGSSQDPPADYTFAPDSTNDLLGASLDMHKSHGDDSVPALFARQKKCPYPVMCSARTCCPANTKCVSFPKRMGANLDNNRIQCTSGIPPLCCPTTSNCVGLRGCCPKRAVTCGGKFCAEQGSSCCGSSICPPNTQCNTKGGVSCCAPGELKCLGTCMSTPAPCGPCR
jgi:hypothetical protein